MTKILQFVIESIKYKLIKQAVITSKRVLPPYSSYSGVSFTSLETISQYSLRAVILLELHHLQMDMRSIYF